MKNILDFRNTKVVKVMTPKNSIEFVDGEKTLQQIINFVVKSPYSKYPVYVGDDDKVVGILDVDDVLRYAKNKKLSVKVKKIVRKPYFVPESKEIDDLLTEFEHRKIPLAIVVDEYGEVEGLATIEDILEEIVGEIFDKSNKNSVLMKKVSDKTIRVDAKASIEEVNRRLKLGLKSEHFNTIAGFIEHKLQKIPRKGEQIKLKNGSIIEIDKVTDQTIKSVKIIQK